MSNFDLKKFLTENKLTTNSRLISEQLEKDILQYIADVYIQNAKGGDKRFEQFIDLNLGDAVYDVLGILKDTSHPLHDETKKEYNIVKRDKERGLFEKAVNEEDDHRIVDTKELDAKAAFKKADIDMSRPVMYVIQDGGHGDPIPQGKKDPIEMLRLFERMRQNAIADGRDDNYEFENELGNTVDGAEYKLAYFQEESDIHQIFQ